MTDPTTELLATRGKTHGDYSEQARATMEVMRTLQKCSRWKDMTDEHVIGIQNIVFKLTRAACGDPMEPDHFDDVGGYAKLISQYIRKLLNGQK